MSEADDLKARLAALENSGGGTGGRKKPSPIVAIAGIGGIAALGGLAYVALQPETEAPMPVAQPEEFQSQGDGFGEIAPFVPPAPPEPEVQIVETQAEPNAELLAQLAALQAQIEAIQNAPEPVVEEDTAAADAINALTEQISALQASSEAAQQQFQDELEARDRDLERLRMDLELAQLQSPTPAPLGPSQDELLEAERQRLAREEEARRMAELEQRRAAELAFQEARILSPTIAFGGGSGAGDTELSERTLGAVQDFVANGALPTQVTQAEVIANPANTVVQGTMIQAVTETALDSTLPGPIRAIISEDVHSFDGSRVLIPRGSRLIGRYQSGVEIAQQRVTVAWDRIILPNNQTVVISSFGGDELGRSGVTGVVDTRFDERFGSAALISLITALPGAAAAQVENETSAEVLEDVGDDLADSTDSVLSDYLALGPVIYVDQGSRITVMVDRDVEIF
ncbi:TrbI/VirB10 family protein [Phaeobacter inhibens]|uniref:TrbI/VirB10 family protein n=1 Tax=Phaeobacter inhibens TaxID=221822 RepID=UPI000C9CF30C|nr:TrbI/VirB10 family protein [Phaeobacter inhibens]AUQ60944.1 Type IV secretory pathway, VirB10 component [Phaeobacter inhibens]AUQ72827.1 Type IV secretory pathway, VirB10 component [Phaeobacter inhibens]